MSAPKPLSAKLVRAVRAYQRAIASIEPGDIYDDTADKALWALEKILLADADPKAKGGKR